MTGAVITIDTIDRLITKEEGCEKDTIILALEKGNIIWKRNSSGIMIQQK